MFGIIKKLTLNKILKSKGRFISVIAITLLGVGVFVGLKSAALNMNLTMDKYLDDTNTYDIKIASDSGLPKQVVSIIKDLDNVEDVSGSYEKDVIMDINGKEPVIRLHDINDTMNKVTLSKGRLPSSNNEIVLEDLAVKDTGIKIGDYVTLKERAGTSFKVVGTVKSPLHFRYPPYGGGHGNTKIGTGTVNYFAYVLEDVLKTEDYTTLYVTVTGAKEKIANSDEYRELINKVLQENNIEEFKEKAQRLTDAKFYVLTRNDYTYYQDYYDLCDSIENLSKIFPVIFFAVAIIMNVITMSRIVDEDRQEIGNLKALGFSNRSISASYLLYAIIATVLGGAIGSVVGFWLIPKRIWSAVSIIVDIPIYVAEYKISYTIIGLVIALISTNIVTYLSTRKTLKETVPELARTKTANVKARTFIEKLPIVKDKMSFQNKLILRNMISYKKKIIMTFVGILGSALLIFIGFSIKYAITGIAQKQYGRIYNISYMISVDEDTPENKIDRIFDIDGIKEYQKARMISATSDKNTVSINTLDKPYTDLINLYDYKTGERLNFTDNKVLLSEKLAILTNKNVGDTIDLELSDGTIKTFEISGIFENYWEHSVFMNVKTYEKNFERYSTNSVCLSLDENADKEKIVAKLSENSEVQLILSIDDAMVSVKNKLDALNKIVWLCILASGALSILILYNLTAINISERKIEIQTIKMMGFTDREVNKYIINENVILSILGLITALLIGKPVALFIIKKVEIQIARYMYDMRIESYIYTVICTLLFMLIINLFTRKFLERIKIKE